MSSLDLYFSNERWSANGIFPTSILDNFPGDTVAKFMLKECEEWRAPDLPIPPWKRAWDNQHAKTLQFETRAERFNACVASPG